MEVMIIFEIIFGLIIIGFALVLMPAIVYGILYVLATALQFFYSFIGFFLPKKLKNWLKKEFGPGPTDEINENIHKSLYGPL